MLNRRLDRLAKRLRIRISAIAAWILAAVFSSVVWAGSAAGFIAKASCPMYRFLRLNADTGGFRSIGRLGAAKM